MTELILDTDIGSDCDDAGALALLCHFERAGKCRLVAVTLSTPSPYAAGCTDAILAHYGKEIPVGRMHGRREDAAGYETSYGREICRRFPVAQRERPDSLTLLRATLATAAREGRKVRIVAIGSLTNLAALLQSDVDGFSPLSGPELMARAVEGVYVMGGWFPSERYPQMVIAGEVMRAEFNIRADIPAARLFFEACPVPVYLSHYLIGYQIRIGQALAEAHPACPVAQCYLLHSGGCRESWDPVTAYCAVLGADGVFGYSQPGRVTVDADGVTAFCAGAGQHRLITCPDFGRAQRVLEDLLAAAGA